MTKRMLNEITKAVTSDETEMVCISTGQFISNKII